jgi:ribosomal protein S18 acetylase RimI-like enzyme
MTVRNVATDNLASFVAATSGRRGSMATLRGGRAVAGPVAVANGFIDAVFRLDTATPVDQLLQDADAFFRPLERPFVLWAPSSDGELVAGAIEHGGDELAEPAPAMTIDRPVDFDHGFTMSVVDGDPAAAEFSDVCERGYAIAGLGWLLQHFDAYSAPGATWAIASDGNTPVAVACSFVSGTSGGVYFVGTPPEHRGRGAGAAVTAYVTNEAIARGATSVSLQSSPIGLRIYARLGFTQCDSYRRFTFTPAS